MSVNKVTLLGNICADPRITTFDNGGRTAQFSLATNERAFKTKDGKEVPERTEFHNVVINAQGLVGVAEKYLKKGDKVYLEGKLKTRAYDIEGQKHFITEVYVSTLEMLTPKGDGGKSATHSAQPPAPTPAPDDDLPF